jgi:hypothetical protein
VGLFVGWVTLSLGAVGCVGEEERGGSDCERFCERLASLECTTESLEECQADCASFEVDLPDGCRGPWNAYLSCASHGEWVCEPGTCIPRDEEPCTETPELRGCEEQQSALAACFDDGGCTEEEGGGGSGTTQDGRTIDYHFASACGYCPMPLLEGALEGFPCTDAFECAEACCACPDGDIAASACVAGICADPCDPSLALCEPL